MKRETIIKVVSIISYSSIILMGQMIGIPLIMWLIITSFEFGNSDQIYAASGLVGMIFMFSKFFNKIIIKLVIFTLMLTPIIARLIQVPNGKFVYVSFLFPLIIFVLSFLILFFRKAKRKI